MGQQPMATSSPAAVAASPDRRGAVLSIDFGRKRRLRTCPPGEIVRVLVVGRHAITRAALCRLLEDDPGLAVVGEARSAGDAARLDCTSRADVVLLDAGCVEHDATDLTHALGGSVALLLLTECEADDRLLAALRAGATGVLPKDSHPAQLAFALRTIARGGALLPPRTIRRLIAEFVKTTPAATP